MNDIVIRAENLSKCYNIASGKHVNNTLRDELAKGLRSVFTRNGRTKLHNKTFWALKNASLEIGRGEVVGIVGQNGAGKSTLLKIISQITTPTSGRAEIFGRVGSLLEVGTGFHPELTGRENIYLCGAILGMKKKEILRCFDAIVEFSGVGEFLDVPVKRYSSGMYVRLGFAVAAHFEPEVLLVDEVLAVGDVAFQKKCLGKIGETARAGRTVLFVSHNMIAINSLCTRTIWVKDGEIVADGPTSEVVTRYLGKSLQGVDSTEECWEDIEEAPGEDTIRLHRVTVRRRDGDGRAPLTMQTPFQVEVEFWNLQPDVQLHITLHLYTAEHVIAFTTAGVNDSTMPAGLYRSVCHFPGDLLNSGLHRFVILAVKNTSSVIYQHASRVPINILDLNERHGSWYGREPGVVQPKLEWTTECLSESSMVNPVAL